MILFDHDPSIFEMITSKVLSWLFFEVQIPTGAALDAHVRLREMIPDGMSSSKVEASPLECLGSWHHSVDSLSIKVHVTDCRLEP